MYLNNKLNSDKNTGPLFFSFASENPELTVQVIDQIKYSLKEHSSLEIECDGQILDLNFITNYEIILID